MDAIYTRLIALLPFQMADKREGKRKKREERRKKKYRLGYKSM
jgi:hypothetical protein